jgi:hypothetical protein
MSCSVVANRPVDPVAIQGPVPTQSEQSAPKPSAHEQKVEGVATQVLAKIEPKEGVAVKVGRSTGDAPPAVTQADLKEREFLRIRKKIIHGRLQKWKATYDPKPELLLSFQKGMAAIIHTECLDALDLFMSKIAKAPTREKVAHLLRKNEAIMVANLRYMSGGTKTKVQEAQEIIHHELEKLGNPAEPAKNTGANKLKGVSPKDPLFDIKNRLLDKLNEWKAGFTPVANRVITTFFSGKKEGIVSKTENLLKEIYKGIVRAETKENLRAWLESRRQLMAEYTHLLNDTAAGEIEKAQAILESEMKALAAM